MVIWPELPRATSLPARRRRSGVGSARRSTATCARRLVESRSRASLALILALLLIGGGSFSCLLPIGVGAFSFLFCWMDIRAAHSTCSPPRARCVPSPVNGGGLGRGHAERSALVRPSPPLPRKRGREQTEFVARCAPASRARVPGRR